MKYIVKKVAGLYKRIRYARFYQLKHATNGMLSPTVYGTLYDLCRGLPDQDIIEIGTATGTGSIAIALAMKETGKHSKLITVERCVGGSRQEVGGYGENIQLIQRHFALFDVSDRITLFPHKLPLTAQKNYYPYSQREN